MVKKWIALSIAMIASQAVLADAPMGQNRGAECCPPCCVPKEKKCIDCECYVPAYYDLQCDYGFFLDAEFLYWYANEDNLAYAIRNKAFANERSQQVISNITSVDKVFYIDSEWCPGVRAGIGWNGDCDGWDTFLYWTWFKNSASDTKNVGSITFPPATGDTFLTNPWASKGAAPFSKIKGEWEYTFNSFNLELGKKYWLSSWFTMRPYAGLRGAWTDTKFEVTTTPHTRTIGSTQFEELLDTRFDNCFWGVGFSGGVQPTWYWTRCFAIYGGFGGALLWGERQVQRKASTFASDLFVNVPNDFIETTDVKSDKSCRSGMQAILDLAVGFRWENTYCCDRYRLAIDAGWEHHIWFDHNNRWKTYDPVFDVEVPAVVFSGSFDETFHNVGFGGFVFRVHFDF